MSYYPGWFDYAKWIPLLCAVVCFLAMNAFKPGRPRGYLRLTGCILVAIGLCFGAVISIVFDAHAPHIAAEGAITLTSIHSGKGSSTTFSLTNMPLTGPRLRMDGAHHQVVDGERADVTYQAQTGTVLSLHVLDRPNAGFDYTDTVGGFGPYFVFLIAAAFALYGIIDWNIDGTAKPLPKRQNRYGRV